MNGSQRNPKVKTDDWEKEIYYPKDGYVAEKKSVYELFDYSFWIKDASIDVERDAERLVGKKNPTSPPKGHASSESLPCKGTHTYIAHGEEELDSLSNIRVLEDWMKVVFSDENPFKRIGGTPKWVRRPTTVSRYHPKYTVRAIKHSDQAVVCSCFSKSISKEGLNLRYDE